MVTIAKKSTILLSLLVLLTIHSLHAQSDFISVNASANATTATLVTDGDATTGRSPGTTGAGTRAAATVTSTNPSPVAGAAQPTSKPWLNPKLPIDQRVTTLLSIMTPAQKMELLREGWGIPGIPSLGVPAMNKVEDIPGFSYGSGATTFPRAITLGATWDKTPVEKVAMAIGDETVSANTVQAWAPVLDVAQDSRWGHCEESFGEDPILVSEIGGAWIKGYQSKQYIL